MTWAQTWAQATMWIIFSDKSMGTDLSQKFVGTDWGQEVVRWETGVGTENDCV